jgi:hypothetical protein
VIVVDARMGRQVVPGSAGDCKRCDRRDHGAADRPVADNDDVVGAPVSRSTSSLKVREHWGLAPQAGFEPATSG